MSGPTDSHSGLECGRETSLAICFVQTEKNTKHEIHIHMIFLYYYMIILY